MCQYSVNLPTWVLELAPKLPASSGWALALLASRPKTRFSKALLMLELGKSEPAVRKAMAELLTRELISGNSADGYMFSPAERYWRQHG